MAPPNMVVEIQMMKERMNLMLNALRGRVSSDLDELVQWTGLPFTAFVTSFPLLSSFPYYAKRSCKDMVPQVDAQLHQYLQGAEHAVCLTLYRGHRYKSPLRA